MFPLRLCGGKLSVAVTRERRYGPSRLRVNDDDEQENRSQCALPNISTTSVQFHYRDVNASLVVGQFRRRSSLTNHSNRRSGNISARPVIGRFVTDLDTVKGRLRARHRSTLETVPFRRGKGCPGKLYRRDSESVQSRVAFCARDRGGSSIYSQIGQVRWKVPFYRGRSIRFRQLHRLQTAISNTMLKMQYQNAQSYI